MLRNIIMKRFANIIVILMVAMAFQPGYAQDGIQGVILTDDQSYALALVNQIRMDPLAYAESLGYDRDALRQELPWMTDILDKGLPPCHAIDDLNLLAEEKNSSAQQSVIEETVQEADDASVETPPALDLVLTGEMGGVVSFYNYMSAEFAWEIVIRNQFLQELEADMEGSLCILNPGFDSMGMALVGGTNEVNGETKNAYFATICFASSRLKSEAQVLNLVNQVRYNSNSIETYLESSLIKLLDYNLVSLSKWFWLYTPFKDGSTLPPLFENLNLQESARSRAMGLLTPGDFSQQEMDSTFPEDGMDEDDGADKVETGENIDESVALPVMVPTDVTSDQLAAAVFREMLGSELRNFSTQGAIFSIGTNQGGVGIALGSGGDIEQPAGVVLHTRIASGDDLSSIDGVSSVEDKYSADETSTDETSADETSADETSTDETSADETSADETSADGADQVDVSRVGIYGVVFSDIDGNEIYSPGEEQVGVCVEVFRTSDNIRVARTFTDGAGHFTMNLDMDLEYRFELSAGQQSLVSFSKVVDKSLYVPVDLSPHYP